MLAVTACYPGVLKGVAMPARDFTARSTSAVQSQAVARAGELAGFAAGLAVTLALRFSPKWSRPVAADTSQGGRDYPLQARHEPVVGPKLAARADAMPPGRLRDLVTGFADGATAAPPATYQLELRLSRVLAGH
jgi:hypothetical protein